MNGQMCYSKKSLMLILLVTLDLIDSVNSDINGFKAKQRRMELISKKMKRTYRLIDILNPVRVKRQEDEVYDEYDYGYGGGGSFFMPHEINEGEDYDGGRGDLNGKDPNEEDSTTSSQTTSESNAHSTKGPVIRSSLNSAPSFTSQYTGSRPTPLTNQFTASSTLYKSQVTIESKSQTVSPLSGTPYNNRTTSSSRQITESEEGDTLTSELRGQSETMVYSVGETERLRDKFTSSTSSSGHSTPAVDEETLTEFINQSETVVSLGDESDPLKDKSTSTSGNLANPQTTTVHTKTTVSGHVNTGSKATLSPDQKSSVSEASNVTTGEAGRSTLPNNRVTPKAVNWTTSGDFTDTTYTVPISTNNNNMIDSTVNSMESLSGSPVYSNSSTLSPDMLSDSNTSSNDPLVAEMSTSSQYSNEVSPIFDVVSNQNNTKPSPEFISTTSYTSSGFSSGSFLDEEEGVSSGGSFPTTDGLVELSGGDEDSLVYTDSSVLTTQASLGTISDCPSCEDIRIMAKEFTELKVQNQELQKTLLELSHAIHSNTEQMEQSAKNTNELIEQLTQNVSSGQEDIKDIVASLLGGMEERLMNRIENLTDHRDNLTHQMVSPPPTTSVSSLSSVTDLSQCVYHTSTNQSSTDSPETWTDWNQNTTQQSPPEMKVSSVYCTSYGGTSTVLQRVLLDQHQQQWWQYRCVCSGKLRDSSQRFCELHIWECPV